jgi:hypothetical protein
MSSLISNTLLDEGRTNVAQTQLPTRDELLLTSFVAASGVPYAAEASNLRPL